MKRNNYGNSERKTFNYKVWDFIYKSSEFYKTHQNNDNASKKDDDEIALNSTKDLRDFDLTAEITVSHVKYLQDEIKNVNLYTPLKKNNKKIKNFRRLI